MRSQNKKQEMQCMKRYESDCVCDTVSHHTFARGPFFQSIKTLNVFSKLSEQMFLSRQHLFCLSPTSMIHSAGMRARSSFLSSVSLPLYDFFAFFFLFPLSLSPSFLFIFLPSIRFNILNHKKHYLLGLFTEKY